MKSIGTYVYCLVAGHRAPAVRGVRSRLPGARPVRLIEQPAVRRGLKKWLVVSDVPLDRYGEEAINRRLSDLDWVSRAAVAHEAVVEAFLDAPAIVPMKLFTIFNTDERAVEHLTAHGARIDAALRRVRGRLEFGVRVTLDRSKPVAPTRADPPATGAAYLAGKKAQRDQTAELVERARETVAELYDSLSRIGAESLRRTASELPLKGGPLLLDAAVLVPRTRVVRFRAAVARAARTLGAKGYHVTLTGPWPPYSFVRD